MRMRIENGIGNGMENIMKSLLLSYYLLLKNKLLFIKCFEILPNRRGME